MNEYALARMLKSMGDDDRSGLTDEQIETRLTEYFAMIHEPEPEKFEPGQIVWHKYPSLAYVREADKPGIFLSYLARPISGIDLIGEPDDLGGTQAAMVLDARVLLLRQGRIAPFLVESCTLTTTRPKRA